jgi:hypothetical protein
MLLFFLSLAIEPCSIRAGGGRIESKPEPRPDATRKPDDAAEVKGGRRPSEQATHSHAQASSGSLAGALHPSMASMAQGRRYAPLGFVVASGTLPHRDEASSALGSAAGYMHDGRPVRR